MNPRVAQDAPLDKRAHYQAVAPRRFYLFAEGAAVRTHNHIDTSNFHIIYKGLWLPEIRPRNKRCEFTFSSYIRKRCQFGNLSSSIGLYRKSGEYPNAQDAASDSIIRTTTELKHSDATPLRRVSLNWTPSLANSNYSFKLNLQSSCHNHN